jgi:hypothetical protein
MQHLQEQIQMFARIDLIYAESLVSDALACIQKVNRNGILEA